jgi:hypothetical protein
VEDKTRQKTRRKYETREKNRRGKRNGEIKGREGKGRECDESFRSPRVS